MKRKTSGPEQWAREFRMPGVWYRGAPFWSWNERLTPEECVRQSRDMLNSGMGGGFMHSREGLETPYMGPEWMTCINGVVEDSRKSGFLAWLYDEDRWPSGAGGGLVTGPHPEYRLKALIYNLCEATEYRPSDEDVAAFGVEITAGKVTSIGDVSKGDHVVSFRMLVSETSGWYNDGAYLDTLSRDAVRCFIDSTHEVYKREVGDDFGKTVPGIFTDEPNYGAFRGSVQRPYVPWTVGLEKVFEERYGYSLTERLPCLFFKSVKGMNARKVRRDYWDCATHLFVTNFSKQIGDWCEEAGIALTGHYLAEGTLVSQTRVIGAAMRHYEHQQVPGIDILADRISEDLTVKQCSSVAAQMGRSRILSELYGCNGWDFTFEGQKWIGDWQMAGGVNYRCQHLTLYGLRGLRKRDYPPSFNYQSPWWPYNKPLENYFARLSYMLSTGKPVRDVLVINPIESAWAQFTPEDQSGAAGYDRSLVKVMTSLFDSHADFDFGDEEMLGRLGRARRGRLQLGEASYSVVVVPPALTLRSSTLRLLGAFAKSGGAVIAVKPVPKLVDCESSDDLEDLAHKTVGLGGDALAKAVSRALGGKVRIREGAREAKGVRYQLRQAGRSRMLFVCNTDRRKSRSLKITLPAAGQVAEWNLVDGSRSAVGAKAKGGKLVFGCELGPTGSALYVAGSGAAKGLSQAKRLKKKGKPVPLKKKWAYELDEPNAVNLDFCRYSLDGAELSERMPVWRAERLIRRTLGLPESSTGSTQRWKKFPQPAPTGHRVTLEYQFSVDVVPAGAVELAIERPEIFEIELNGSRVPSSDNGWFVDRSFRRVPLTGAGGGGGGGGGAGGSLKPGTNTIRLTANYNEEHELEEIYLLGDFGVDDSLALTTRPEVLATGDWVKQGLPFYSGSVTYRQVVEVSPKASGRAFITISGCDCTVLEVFVNGRSASVVMWPPFEADVTDLLKDGENEIAIKVVSSRKNLLGPLHHTAKKLSWTGAAQFRTEGDQWTDGYSFVPYGIRGRVAVEWRG